MIDSIVATPKHQRSPEVLKTLFFLFLNVDMPLKNYVCNPSDKELFAAAMNFPSKSNLDGLDKLHAWSMVGVGKIGKEKAKLFFTVLHGKLVKTWLQDERLTPSDFVRMVREDYIKA